MGSRLIELAAEMRRRKVFRTTGVYFVAVFGVSQGAAELMPLFGVSEWTIRAVVIALVLFTPVVILLSWRFDISSSGIVRDRVDLQRERARELEREREQGLERGESTLSDTQTIVADDTAHGCVRVSWHRDGVEDAILFAHEFTLGRGHDCSVRLLDVQISRTHARVSPENGGWVIHDLGSTNGTWVDGDKISRRGFAQRCEVRLNSVGPILYFEPIPPGPASFDAIAEAKGDPDRVSIEVPSGARANEREHSG